MPTLHTSAPGLKATNSPAHHPALSQVAEALARLRFGVVQLTVHDGRVVQLDVTDRKRFG